MDERLEMNERDRATATLPAAALTFRSCLTDRERGRRGGQKDRGGEGRTWRAERERERGLGGAVDYSTRRMCVYVCVFVLF